MRLDVIIVGAGISGLCAGAKLREAGIESFLILEKGDAVGGTWRDNRYPGAACDVPSHLYSYSFDLKPDWSRWYAPQPEIQDYLESFADRFGLREKVRLGTAVEEIRFGDSAWSVSTSRGERLESTAVVAAMGGLHTPAVPRFEGLAAFEGEVFHTAQWRDDVALAGRRVAVIGTGATSVQLVPELASLAGELSVFQRSPIWVIPKKDPIYTSDQIQAFRTSAGEMRAHRQEIWEEWEDFTVQVVRDTPLNHKMQARAEAFIRAEVEDPEIAAKLIPDYAYGCKRPTLSNDYYAAFNRPTVELVTESIERVESSGIRTSDGKLRCFDVIVFATGFKAFDITAETKIVGLEESDLRETWRHGGIRAYKSMMMPRFPNFFIMLGPHSAGLTSSFEMIEAQADYIVRMLRYLEEEGLAFVHPTSRAMGEWEDLVAEGIGETLINSGCSSWWTDEHGRNHTSWPFASTRFREALQSLKPSDFVMR